MALTSGTYTELVNNGGSDFQFSGTRNVSYTVPGGSDGLVAIIIVYSNFSVPETVSSVSYDGDAMTEEANFVATGLADNRRIYVYSLISPTAGTSETFSYTVDGSDSNRHIVAVVPLTGANTSDLVGAEEAVQGEFDDDITDNITTTEDGSIIIGVVASDGGDIASYTPGTGVTEKIDSRTGTHFNNDFTYFIGEMDAATAGTFTFSAEQDSAADDWSSVIFEVFAAAGGGSTTTSDVPAAAVSLNTHAPTSLRSLISNVPAI